MISATQAQLLIIKDVLVRHAPGVEARVFGSRLTGAHKEYSDLDLALVADTRLPAETLAALREAFAESDLPFRVDLLDWHAISPEFQGVISKQFELLGK